MRRTMKIRDCKGGPEITTAGNLLQTAQSHRKQNFIIQLLTVLFPLPRLYNTNTSEVCRMLSAKDNLTLLWEKNLLNPNVLPERVVRRIDQAMRRSAGVSSPEKATAFPFRTSSPAANSAWLLIGCGCWFAFVVPAQQVELGCTQQSIVSGREQYPELVLHVQSQTPPDSTQCYRHPFHDKNSPGRRFLRSSYLPKCDR